MCMKSRDAFVIRRKSKVKASLGEYDPRSTAICKGLFIQFYDHERDISTHDKIRTEIDQPSS